MMEQRVWQVLDVGSIWMKEFASALSKSEQTVAWAPVMSYTGFFEDWERQETLHQPQLEVVHYPLQRGYSRAPLNRLTRFERPLLRRLRARAADPARSPLICTTPFYAPVAESWPGPSVYYVTDMTAEYEGMDREQVRALDKRLCRAASAVCPNSRRIAEYLIEQAGCAPDKITVVPNATRESNVSPVPLLTAGELPVDLRELPRPIVGVIGNLSANMDWELIAMAIKRTSYLNWVFVGPVSMPIADREQAAAREWVMKHAHFTGPKPYGELQTYARCFDAAVLPYRRKEPTYSGSSTRFYEHVAACRPMVATRGFAELMEKRPLLELVDTADEMADALDRLRRSGFSDGYESLRWEASREGTWERRAAAVIATIQ